MKKNKKLLAGLIMGLALLCGGCGNRDMLDTVLTYNYAIIELPDGRIVEGDVQSWKDYENSDSVQVKINGDTYYTHLSNVVLMQVK